MTVIKDPGKEVSNKAVKGKAMFGRKLRDISPKKEKSGLKGDLVNPHSDGDWQTTNGMDKIASMHSVQKYSLHIGDGVDEEPFTVATVSGKDGRKLAPDVGFKHAPESIKKARGIKEEVVKFVFESFFDQVQERLDSINEAFGKALGPNTQSNDNSEESWTGKNYQKPEKKSEKFNALKFRKQHLQKEEVEEIDEISVGKLRDYHNAADKDTSGKDRSKHKARAIEKILGAHSKRYNAGPMSRAKVSGTDFDKATLRKEEVEELDEISVRKVNRYMDRAEDDLSHRISDGAGGRVPEDQHRSHGRKVNNRSRGLNTALDKLTVGKYGPIAKVPANESLDELSIGTLNSYRSRAFLDQHKNILRIAKGPISDEDQKHYRKRGKGQELARKKMYRQVGMKEEVEETELDEMTGKKKVPEIKSAWSRSRDINDRLARDKISRGDIRGASSYHKKAEDAETRASRASGIMNRIKARRINEEEEHIEELTSKGRGLDRAYSHHENEWQDAHPGDPKYREKGRKMDRAGALVDRREASKSLDRAKEQAAKFRRKK